MSSTPVSKAVGGQGVSDRKDQPLLEAYVVERGDRFDAIAADAGLTPNELHRFNKHIKNRDWIIAGETTIYLPADRLEMMRSRSSKAKPPAAPQRRPTIEPAGDSVVRANPRVLRAGDTDAELPALKRALAALGFLVWDEAKDPNPTKFDSATAKALWDFQGDERYFRHTADGAVGAATRQALRKALQLPAGAGPLHETSLALSSVVGAPESYSIVPQQLAKPAAGGVNLRPVAPSQLTVPPNAPPSVPPLGEVYRSTSAGGTAVLAGTTSELARGLDVVEQPKTRLVAGREGREVSMLERMMNRIGAGVRVDGDFGPELQREVIQWQKALVKDLGIDDKTKAGRKELAKRGWHYGVVNGEQWEILLRKAAAVTQPSPSVATFPPIETVASGSERRAYEILQVLALESPRDFRALVSWLQKTSPTSTAPVVVDAALIDALVRATDTAGLSLSDDVERDLARLSFRSDGGIGFNGARAVTSLLHDVFVLKKPPITNKYEKEIRAAVGDDPELYKLVRALIMQESNYNPKVRSPKGATGLMQIMPDTARSLDPKLKGKSDDEVVRYLEDPTKNIRMGVRYLKSLLEKFGHWHLALAAYNWGENRDSLLAFRDGKTDEVSAVARAPAETQDYMQKVLRNAAFYGHASRADATTVSQAPVNPGTKRRRDG